MARVGNRDLRWCTSSASGSSAAGATSVYEDPQPRLFSFNNPFGACPTCHGFGNVIELDLDLVVPDKTKSIRDGAIEPWTKPHYRAELATLKRDAKRLGVRLDTPWQELTDEQRGSSSKATAATTPDPRVLRVARAQEVQGARPGLPEPYRGYLTCPACSGTRLRQEARDVRVSGKTIDRASAMTVSEAQAFFGGLALGEQDAAIADKVLREIVKRLRFLGDVGLDYLTLDRLSSTLSRRRIATHQPGDVAGLGAGRDACTSSTSRPSGCIPATTCG